MHDRDEFVSELLARAKGLWTAMWAALPNERRLRLASLESELGMIGRQLQLGQWKLVAERLDEFGARIEGRCDGCRYRRERRRDQVEVDVLGQFDAVRADLAAHASRRRARPTDEHRQCRVVIARRYLENHESYVDQYAEIRRRDLPVGSGEAESGVRHLLKRRMSIAGAWTEAMPTRCSESSRSAPAAGGMISGPGATGGTASNGTSGNAARTTRDFADAASPQHRRSPDERHSRGSAWTWSATWS